jgi:hypothetical protein
MALQLYKIGSVEVGSAGSATISFSSIPSGYTDLLIKITTRDTTATVNLAQVKMTFNGSATGYTNRNVYGNGSSTTSQTTATTSIDVGIGNSMPTAGNTANTFSNGEVYIPNYAGSNNKSVSTDIVGENNTTAAYAGITAGLWSNTAAITSISFAPTTLFAQYTTATLYGIL